VSSRRARPAARASAAVLRRPAPAAPRVGVGRVLPSGRSVAAGAALLLSGLIAFAVARQSSVFAIRTIEVDGAPPALERQVRAALAPLVGTSLVALDGGAVERRLTALRQVRGLTYDRAFPHTLRVFVQPDRPAAVLRSGPDAWLVSDHGAVLRHLSRPFSHGFPRLPRLWLSPEDAPTVRSAVLPARVVAAVRGLAEARRIGSSLLPQVRTVKAAAGNLTFVLRSGIQLRLGDARDVALKLAVAGRVLQALSADERAKLKYLDLTLPSRPVTGTNPRL
jgi:cell division septal protein FtsQ